MKNNDYEYFTYEADELGITDVYGWTRYRSGALAGQPRKVFMANFASTGAALAKFPGAYDRHPAFESPDVD